MSVKYPFEGHTRVALLSDVNNPSAPTLTELAAGVDITCDLTVDGLRLPRETVTVDATPWKGTVVVERPTRVSMSGASLTGFRFLDPADEVLWPVCVFKDRAFLIVRRGLPVDIAWDDGQVAEVLSFQFGRRALNDPGGDALATFTVPIFVSAETDDSVVAA